MVISGVFVSSKRYRRRSEGRAIKIRIIPGIIVQIVSISWPSRRVKCVNGLVRSIIYIYSTRDKIIIKINSV